LFVCLFFGLAEIDGTIDHDGAGVARSFFFLLQFERSEHVCKHIQNSS